MVGDVNIHRLSIVPTDRNGRAHIFLKDGHGNFSYDTEPYNRHCKSEEEVIEGVKAFFEAIRKGELV